MTTIFYSTSQTSQITQIFDVNRASYVLFSLLGRDDLLAMRAYLESEGAYGY